MREQVRSKTKPHHGCCSRIGLRSPEKHLSARLRRKLRYEKISIVHRCTLELCCDIQSKTRSRVGRNISLIKRANEEKETRQTLLELRSGHDADATVNVLA
jgi:hypothetical protein